MKKTVIAASASLMGVFSINSAAMASDSWSGFHGGLSVGYQDGQLLGSNGSTLGYYGFINPDPGSPTIGAFVGYNYQVPQTPFVASLEASLNIGGEERTRAGAKFPASHPEAKVSVPYATAVKARFGYAIDKFLPYVQGGVVGAETRFRVTDDDGFYAGTNKFATGWLAGIGVDYAIDSNLFVRGSYSYTRLENTDYIKLPTEFNHRFELNDFQLGIGYKF